MAKSRRKKFTTMYPAKRKAAASVGEVKRKALVKRKARLGTGARFAALKGKLAVRPGVSNPGGLAAYIGRKKYGAKKFAQLGAKGRS